MRSGRRLLPLVFFTLCASLLAQSNPVLFAPVVTYESGGSYSFAVALGDVNGDGKLDVVVGSKCPIQSQCPYASGGPLGLISVLGGNGDGTFQSPVDYSSGGYTPLSVGLADLNGDGHLDIVVVNLCQDDSYCAVHGEVSILLNNGDGTFHLTAQYDSAGQEPASVAIRDMNGDGHPDLVVVNVDSRVSVFMNDGDGTFGTPSVYNSGGWGSQSVAIADVNGDGHLDVVVSNFCYTYASCSDGANIGVLLNNGDGSLESALNYPSGGEATYAMAVADINGDGTPDVIAAHQCSLGSHYICSTSIVSVLLNNGDGTFKAPMIYGSGGWYAYSVEVADVNGDGKLDLVLTNACASAYCSSATAGWLVVLVGNGDGTFQTPQRYSSGGIGAMSIAIADVNGDGKPDLLAATACVSSTCSGTGYPGENPGSIAVFINITPWPYKAFVQPPINADASSMFKANRGVIPVKFSLTKNNTAICDLPAATIAVTRTAGGTTGAIDEASYLSPADNGSNFRITACHYVYNLAASVLGVGTYHVDIKLNGVAVGSAVFALK
jgi:hypothetical protein